LWQKDATMNPATRLITGAAVLVFATSAGFAQNFGNSEDEAAIRKIVVEMTDGFNKHDAQASTSMYTPEADFVSVRGEVGTGKVEAEKGLARIFATRAKTAVLKTENVQIRFIRPDVALVHVTNELSGLINADGQALPSHRELSLRVFVKDAAVWRVASFHNTIVQPFGSAPPKP
jgi:uncharacterized protein (TIGR02246 family)